MKQTKLTHPAEILHNLPFEAISVTVDKTTTGTTSERGRTILKAGTLLAGDGASIFADRSKKVKLVAPTEATIDGILLYDVDLTDGDADAALVYRGTIREDKLPVAIGENKSKLPHIVFVKGV